MKFAFLTFISKLILASAIVRERKLINLLIKNRKLCQNSSPYIFSCFHHIMTIMAVNMMSVLGNNLKTIEHSCFVCFLVIEMVLIKATYSSNIKRKIKLKKW
jgi:hypothetical protein